MCGITMVPSLFDRTDLPLLWTGLWQVATGLLCSVDVPLFLPHVSFLCGDVVLTVM